MALLNYVREELVAEQTVSDAIMDTVKGLKIDAKSVTLQILKDKVLELYERASSIGHHGVR